MLPTPLLERAVALTGLGAWSVDLDDGRLFWSSETRRIHECDPDFMPDVSSGISFYVEPDRPVITEAFTRCCAAGEGYDLRLRIRTARGNLRWVRTIGEAFRDADGRIVRVEGAFWDISDEVLGRQRLESLVTALDAAASPVVITSAEGRIEWMNRAFAQLSGYAIEECFGRTPGELVKSGRQADDFYREMWTTITDGRVWTGELYNRRKSGEEYLEHMTITPILDGDVITGFVANKRDITQERRREEQVLQLQRMDSLGSLAGGIAHDLNNVFAPILMSLDFIQTEVAVPEVQEELDVMSRAVRRGAALVRQLLQFARGVDDESRSFDLAGPLGDVLSLCRETFPRGLRLDCPSLPHATFVDGSPSQLYQAFLNLLVNARDACDGEGLIRVAWSRQSVKPSLEAHPAARPGDYVVVEVSDDGVGIPVELLSRIFDPFFTTKGPTKGTGLGLATTHSIVRRHRGFITVESTVGVGSAFRVHLPVSSDVPRPARASSPHPTQRGRGERVLVVDDERAVRESLSRGLARLGFDVHTAEDGVEALARDDLATFDVAIVDMSMPRMTGEDLIAALRAKGHTFPIILSSGVQDTSSHPRVSCLLKPYPMATLTAMLRELTARGGAKSDDPRGGTGG